MKEKLSLLIHSCGAYSDLWDGQIRLLNTHWGDRHVDTYILTDTNPRGLSYEGVTILEAGAGSEITERIQCFLKVCRTRYVFVTLDDYYLIRSVSIERIRYLIHAMEDGGLSYLRIFKLGSDGEPMPGTDRLHRIRLDQDKSRYYINLYPGIWDVNFMERTIRKPLNAWQYEVSLTPIARELGVTCAVDRQDDYVILDVVRKGKLLHKAARYFKKHPGLYTGDRAVNTYRYEWKLKLIAVFQKVTPKSLQHKVKAYLKKKGRTFFSN